MGSTAGTTLSSDGLLFVLDIDEEVPRARKCWPGIAVAGAGSTLVTTALVTGNPSLVLLGLVATMTAAFARRFSWDLAVIMAGTFLLTVSIVTGLVAALVHIDLIAAGWLLGAVYVLGSLRITWKSWANPRWRGGPPCGRWGSLAFLPAVVAVATALLQGARTTAVQSWGFFATDLVHHMTILAQVQRDGQLDYGLTDYPRGLHMLAALASVPNPPLDDPRALLGYDLRLTGALTWLALALMTWTGTALAIRLGTAADIPRAVAVTAAACFGCLTLLTNTFLEGFVDQGAAPSLLAVAVLYGYVLAAVTAPDWFMRPPVLTASSAVSAMLLAHLWQALAIVPFAAAAVAGLPLLKGGQVAALRAKGRTSWLVGLAIAAGALLAVAVPMAHTVHAGGLSQAAQPGDLGGDPWRLLLPALLVSPTIARWSRLAWSRVMIGSVLGLAVVLAALMHGAGHGVDLNQWYPLKASWFLTLFLAPWLALIFVLACAWAVTPLWRLVGQLPRCALVGRTALLASISATAVAVWLPWQLGPTPDLGGAWRLYDQVKARAPQAPRPLWAGGAYDLAFEYGGRFGPAVVVPYALERGLFSTAYSDLIVSELLSFQTGQPELHGARNVCDAVAIVAGRRPAVVITRLPSLVVEADMARHGCAGRAKVVHLEEAF